MEDKELEERRLCLDIEHLVDIEHSRCQYIRELVHFRAGNMKVRRKPFSAACRQKYAPLPSGG